jgi:transglutaminase-like putative cysteine protease
MPEPRRDQVLHVVHETGYRYSTRVELAHHLAHLRPLEDAFQTLESFELDVSPEPSHRTESRDRYGNARVFFSLTAAHEALRVRAESIVHVASGRDEFAPAASAPWETVADSMTYRAGAPFRPETDSVYASPFVPMHAELRDYAASSFAPDAPIALAAIDLMHRIHADFAYEPASTEITTPVLEAFALRRGVCQDFAHVMIGCLRALGLPARYVSGYLLTEPPPGKPRLQGVDASHAWVSVYCDRLGWIDLDPTNDLVVATSHVTVARGRDYGDVAPLRGLIRGGGAHTLGVSVNVAPL